LTDLETMLLRELAYAPSRRSFATPPRPDLAAQPVRGERVGRHTFRYVDKCTANRASKDRRSIMDNPQKLRYGSHADEVLAGA